MRHWWFELSTILLNIAFPASVLSVHEFSAPPIWHGHNLGGWSRFNINYGEFYRNSETQPCPNNGCWCWEFQCCGLATACLNNKKGVDDSSHQLPPAMDILALDWHSLQEHKVLFGAFIERQAGECFSALWIYLAPSLPHALNSGTRESLPLHRKVERLCNVTHPRAKHWAGEAVSAVSPTCIKKLYHNVHNDRGGQNNGFTWNLKSIHVTTDSSCTGLV